jgi:Tfp pilus assembly protein FimV
MAIAAPFPAAGRTARTSTRVRPVPAARSTRTARRAYTGIRLTSRGRALLMLGSALFLLVTIVVSGRFTADAGSTPAVPATSVVVVQPGENLWQIARRLAPGSDPREVLTQLRTLNHLGSAPVEAGQSIVVPVFDTP